MDASHYLLAANAAVWVGLGGYIFFLARRQALLEQRLQHLEALDNEQHDTRSA
jgi:CcmD family protein